MTRGYSRFAIERPEYLGDEHWRSIAQESERLSRSIDSEDDSQAIADIKSLVEAVAKITVEVAGHPMESKPGFTDLVSQAHGLLHDQPGHGLAYDSQHSAAATQSKKIACGLGKIRNEWGAGHGRANLPNVEPEVLDLALDGGLMWTRWALRRLGYLAHGRPNVLIRDLIETPITFHAGVLRERLAAANLSGLERRHQHALGVAVARRAMQDTFVVRWDGLDPCLESDDLRLWPRDYRLGLTQGLWFNLADRCTLTPRSMREGLLVLDPVSDAGDALQEIVERVLASRPKGPLVGNDPSETWAAEEFLQSRISLRPPAEGAALTSLKDHIAGPPF